jgi:hypothetical protein
MKLPKTVQICGKTFKVTAHKDKSGASFSVDDFTIKIGTKFPQDIPENFVHEVIEAVFLQRGMRYKLYDDSRSSDYLFSFKHEEFQNAVIDIVIALKDYLK